MSNSWLASLFLGHELNAELLSMNIGSGQWWRANAPDAARTCLCSDVLDRVLAIEPKNRAAATTVAALQRPSGWCEKQAR